MTFNPSGHALNRVPRSKRSRQRLIWGLSARKLRRAQEAIDRKTAKAAKRAGATPIGSSDQGNVR